MDFINLAHGVQYMLGAYLVAVLSAWSGSFAFGLAAGLSSPRWHWALSWRCWCSGT